MAHAGAQTECPGNTIPCYRRALEQGADALEADVQYLEDGTLVMFHDRNTFRATGQSYRLDAIGYDTLSRLDAGWGFSPDGGTTHPWRGRGLRVPTLGTFLIEVPKVPVLLDVKRSSPKMSRALVQFAEHELLLGDRERVHIKVPDRELARRLRELDVGLNVAMSNQERLRMGLALRIGMSAHRLPRFAPLWIDLNSGRIPDGRRIVRLVGQWAKRQGHLLTVSTIDDPARMARFLAIPGVDGLVTNRPDRMISLLQQGPMPLAEAPPRDARLWLTR